MTRGGHQAAMPIPEIMSPILWHLSIRMIYSQLKSWRMRRLRLSMVHVLVMVWSLSRPKRERRVLPRWLIQGQLLFRHLRPATICWMPPIIWFSLTAISVNSGWETMASAFMVERARLRLLLLTLPAIRTPKLPIRLTIRTGSMKLPVQVSSSNTIFLSATVRRKVLPSSLWDITKTWV